MKLPIKTFEVDHYVVTIDLFEDADGKLVSADDIVNHINSLNRTVSEQRKVDEPVDTTDYKEDLHKYGGF